MKFGSLVGMVCSLLLASSAHAEELFPVGKYFGHVSDFSMDDHLRYCMPRVVELQVTESAENLYQAYWREEGYRKSDGTPCETRMDAEFVPVKGKKNEWKVRFLWETEWIRGKAKLEKGRVTIQAYVLGYQGGPLYATWETRKDGADLNYRREFRFGGGGHLISDGVLKLR